MPRTNGDNDRFLANPDLPEPMRNAQPVQPVPLHSFSRDRAERQQTQWDVGCVAECRYLIVAAAAGTGSGSGSSASIIGGVFDLDHVCARSAGEEDVGAGLRVADVAEMDSRVERAVGELETDVLGWAHDDVGAIVDRGVRAEREVADRLHLRQCSLGKRLRGGHCSRREAWAALTLRSGFVFQEVFMAWNCRVLQPST